MFKKAFLPIVITIITFQYSYSQSQYVQEKGVFIGSKQAYGLAPNQFSLGYRLNENFSLTYSANQYASSFFGSNPFANEQKYSSLVASYSKYLDSNNKLGYSLSMGIHSNVFFNGTSLSDASYTYSIAPSVYRKIQLNDKIELFPTLTFDTHFNETVSSSRLDLSLPVTVGLGKSAKFVFEPYYILYQPNRYSLNTNSQTNSNLGFRFGIHFK